MIGQQLDQYKTLGMQVLGYYSVNGEVREVDKRDILGDVEEFRAMAAEMRVQDVIIALEKEQQEKWLPVVSSVDDPKVTLKMLPDFHQMVGGYAKTHQIFGLPLVDIQPAEMPTWEWFVKRSLDVLVSAVVLVALLPLILILAIVVRLTSEGPAIYKQLRVGKHGREFTMYKFRSMVNNAEANTGPIWATDDDPRVTRIGYWLRKTRLDEIPQFFNVLFGDMSLVGPRPERPHFVKKYERSIPLYSRRLRVKPGITGWAQVKWKYDESFDDVKERTKYDLFYVENISLRLDVKILINTLFVVLRAEGK
jgi:exopolysaccharide biosynthesis polyprenyl glycosylphosphotransferase